MRGRFSVPSLGSKSQLSSQVVSPKLLPDKKKIKNYRPILPLPILSNILQSSVESGITSFLIINLVFVQDDLHELTVRFFKISLIIHEQNTKEINV